MNHNLKQCALALCLIGYSLFDPLSASIGGSILATRASAAASKPGRDTGHSDDEGDDDEGMEPSAAELGKLKEFSDAGAEDAQLSYDQSKEKDTTFLSFCLKVAKFETADAAKAYHKGFEDRGKKLAQDGTDTAGKAVLRQASRINRVIRAVFGVNRKRTDGTMEHVSMWTGETWTAKDRAATLKVLNSKGDINAKMEALPRTNSGRGATANGEGQTAVSPLQRRINAADDAPASGSLDLLARVFGIGSKTAKTEGEKTKVTGEMLSAGIKATPEPMLPDLVEWTASRLMSSPDPFYKDIGAFIRNHYKAQVAAEAVGKRAERKAKQAERESAATPK